MIYIMSSTEQFLDNFFDVFSQNEEKVIEKE